ncbi:YibE/F family protein [Kineosporia sp. R_H_3]|uniref:YibE/F family protein n=1 Tax=Kineosporia sp. R_H_3 TaxID=1961848 RepID=UPI000B4AF442|nr:YibE/F family protein [Kineosporia sp. R_H_3]
MGRHGAAPPPDPAGAAAAAGHGHSHSHGGPANASRGVVAVLGGLVALVVVLTVAGLVALWPPAVAVPAVIGDLYDGVVFVEGTVESTSRATCEGTSSDRLLDGTIPQTVTCVTAKVRVDPGASAGGGEVVSVAVPSAVERAGLSRGDGVRLTRFPPADGQPAVYAWADRSRRTPLTVLAVVFALAVVAVARLKGLAALGGLAVAYLAIGSFVVPALLAGSDPVLVAVVASSAIMTVLLYLAHGVTVKTTTALLGTLAGLVATALFAWWATAATGLTGLDAEEGQALSQLTTGAGISGVILCGIIIAGLGVLNDVTISQASAVWEIHDAAPHLGPGRLFSAGMRIGRDHLASVVYTIVFVYAGAALPTLMLQALYQRPVGDVVVSGAVAEELVRTLVTSSSLVLTIPLTTAVAALLAASSRTAADRTAVDGTDAHLPA